MNVLILGASSIIGQHLISGLEQSTTPFNLKIANSPREQIKVSTAHQRVVFEIDTPQTYDQALQDVDKVVWALPLMPAITEHAKAFCDAMKAYPKLNHILKISPFSLSTYHHHSLGHEQLDQIIQNAGIPYTILKIAPLIQHFSGAYPWIYQPIDKHINLPCGNGLVAWLDVRDVATMSAHILTEDHPQNQIYHLTGPDAFSAAQMTIIISGAASRTLRHADIDHAECTKRMEAFNLPQHLITQKLALYDEMRDDAFSQTYPDDFERLVGVSPKTAEDFVFDYVSAWKP